MQIFFGVTPRPTYYGPDIGRFLTLMGLDTLQVITNDLNIRSQTSFSTTLSIPRSFPQLKFLGGTLSIVRDVAPLIPVIALFNLPALKQVQADIIIIGQGFQNMLSFSNLTCVGNSTALGINTQLTSLEGFEKVQSFNYRGDTQGQFGATALFGKPPSGKPVICVALLTLFLLSCSSDLLPYLPLSQCWTLGPENACVEDRPETPCIDPQHHTLENCTILYRLRIVQIRRF